MTRRLKHYALLMRLDKPIGIWLCFWPCAWILALYERPLPDYLWFFCGALIMRSAGCVVNDMTDYRLDRYVERTSNRPLASGQLSLAEAFTLLCFLGSLALLLALSLHPYFVPMGAFSCLLVTLYPWMKRLTWWPQAFLGITFNLGIFYAAVYATHSFGLTPVLLYIGALCWTFGYDTLYAQQDKADDARIGIKSSALALGRFYLPAISLAYLLFLACLCLTAAMQHSVNSAFLVGAAIISGLLIHQLWQASRSDPDYGRLFKNNGWLGFMIWLWYAAQSMLN